MMQLPIIHCDINGFDIIGDVHGCASALVRLLEKMGYRHDGVCYRHVCNKHESMTRQVIFVGDLIDRGSEIVETLAIAKAMIDNGQALMVLGNHEFNLLAYHTPVENGYLRKHTSRSYAQIQATLEQFSGQEELLHNYLAWFKTQPLFLEFEQFRVVHACWDANYISAYYQRYKSHCLTEQALNDCVDYSSPAAKAIERLGRGVSLDLPEGYSITSNDGVTRNSFRVDFWTADPEHYQDIIFQPAQLPAELESQKLAEDEKAHLVHYGIDEKPLFIGHYWLSGELRLISDNIACLDYSAVVGGKLVAYRFDIADANAQVKLDVQQLVAVE